MQIDITKLLTNSSNTIYLNEELTIPDNINTDSRITSLNNLKFNGKITLDEANELSLTGKLSGTMILKDDITLEKVNYDFETDIEEILEKENNKVDLTDIMYQNIVVEIPSKVRATSEDIELSGDGWRVISEDTYNRERNNKNNPFGNLNELLKTKEDK